ncbi:MAG: GntR family transcriptional regulator [Limnochordia bacterium]|nr:GntR family transcriptional regulator [Bacillota bacterium]
MSVEGIGKVNSYRTLQSLVYEHIRDAILSGRLAPGQRVVAAKIAEEMGVSRMPVRESLRRLETEGLITTVPHKEAVVRRLSAREMEDIYSVRLVLEAYGGKLAARRITAAQIAKLEELTNQMEELLEQGDYWSFQEANERFHEVFFEASGSAVLCELLRNLWSRCYAYRHFSAAMGKRERVAVAEHREIIRALVDKAEDRVEKLVREHTEKAVEPLLRRLQMEEQREEGYCAEEEGVDHPGHP